MLRQLKQWTPILAAGLAATFLSQSTMSAQSAEATDYSKVDSWLCHPENNADACDRDLTTTVIAADGSTSIEKFTENASPEIDCFYVYPTTSMDETGNSDLIPGEKAEIITAYLQVSRLRAQCRIFAPMYRQITVPGLRGMMSGKPIPMDRSLTYKDVLGAWQHYLENENNGRGFIIIGHSQGAGLLSRLIAAEIDGKPIQKQLVSAVLAGQSITVPEGKKVGGAFKHIPVCESQDQIGCVVAIQSYRDRIPPPANGMFGRGGNGREALCVNPAAPAGGKTELHAYLSTFGEITESFAPYKPWTSTGTEITTPFVSLPGKLFGECVKRGDFSYLELTIENEDGDVRTSDITGDLISGIDNKLNPAWGLHLIDMSLVMGDLMEMVDQQIESYKK
ncbi:DUF3089 domain-containing protein [Aurantivibrio plasticivorans]